MTANLLLTHRGFYKYSKHLKKCFKLAEASRTILKVPELSKYYCKLSNNSQMLLQVL